LITGEWSEARKGASEAEARAARMTFFAAKSRVLWLGHQQDDIAETMLMRLARGSGTAGLAAPRPVQVMPGARTHLRPLLTLKKTEIVAALSAVAVPWREDASNRGDVFLRNRIRRDVLPAWISAVQRDALAGAARSRELLDEDDAALEAWLAELRPLRASGWLDLAVLRHKPRALVRRALHRWVLAESRVGELSRQAFEMLLAAVERGARTKQSVGNAGFAVVRDDRLVFEPAGKPRRRFRGRAN
jgi:tRNA(Ile)-lysidine synthase